MKKFIYKIFTYLISFLLLGSVISLFIPYHWGNPWYSSKIQYLENKKTNNYNTFFFGSSRVYRQINPMVFDSISNSISTDSIKSFNLGAPATFCPQSYYLYENFIDSEISEDIKYCFIELMEVDMLGDYFMHQERTSYWQNIPDLIFVTKSIVNNGKYGSFMKVKSIFNYYISYFENIFHIGHFGQQLMSNDYYDAKYIGLHKNGFFPLELDLKTTQDENVKKHLNDRKESIAKNPELIKVRKDIALNSYRNISTKCDFVNLKRIKALLAKAKLKGIQLFFILSPRKASQELINLFHLIPQENAIDMSNPIKYYQLYLFDNSFDDGHLNTKGAIEYSKLLAQEFVNRSKD